MEDKYKSVVVKREVYEALKALATKNNRTLAGQVKQLLDDATTENV